MTLRDRKERDVAAIISIIRFVLAAASLIAAVFLGFRLFMFLTPILIGLVLARAATGTAEFFAKKLRKPAPAKTSSLMQGKVRKGVSVFFYFIFFILIVLFVFLFVFFLIRMLSTLIGEIPKWLEGSSLIERLTGTLKSVSGSLGGILDAASIQKIEESLSSMQSELIGSLPALLTGILTAITGFFSSMPELVLVAVITIMSGFYFITQSDRLYQTLRRYIPDRSFLQKLRTLTKNLSSRLLRIFGGYIVLWGATFTQALIGMLILGVPNPVLWALVTAFVDFLPLVGEAIVLIPMGIVFLSQGLAFTGIGIFVLFGIMTVTRQLLEPAIIGSALKLHPVIMLLSMVAGIAILGLSGLLLGPLLIVIVREIFQTFHLEPRLRRIIGEFIHRFKNTEADLDEDIDENLEPELAEALLLKVEDQQDKDSEKS